MCLFCCCFFINKYKYWITNFSSVNVGPRLAPPLNQGLGPQRVRTLWNVVILRRKLGCRAHKTSFFFKDRIVWFPFYLNWSHTMFQQTIKHFNIHFNFLDGRTTLSSGDLITGHISFELTKQTAITSITMQVKGWAKVHWSSGTRKRRRHYSAKVDIFDIKSLILQENQGKQ